MATSANASAANAKDMATFADASAANAKDVRADMRNPSGGVDDMVVLQVR